MKCALCGSNNKEGSKFCSECGAKLEILLDTAVEPVEAFAETETAVVEEVNTTVESGAEIPVANEYVEPVAETVDEVNKEVSFEKEPAPEYSDYTAETSSDNAYTNDSVKYESAQDSYSKDDNESYATYEDKKSESVGLAVASLVCGIISILSCITCCGGIFIGIAAIVLGIIAITNNYGGRGMAIGGIACGAVGLIITIVFIVICSMSDVFSAFEGEFCCKSSSFKFIKH